MRPSSSRILVTVISIVVLQDIQGYPSRKEYPNSRVGDNLQLTEYARSLGYFSYLDERPIELDENRIAGGKVAVNSEFPFMAIVHRLLENGYVSQCGGTIISSQWILTAGHCIASYPRRFLVVIGTRTKAGMSYNSSIGARIAMITGSGAVHPEYDKVTNDIGLLRLPLALPFSSEIQPISLATSHYATDLFVGRTVSVIGWGQDSASSTGTEALKYANIPVISNAQCSNDWNIDGRNICTQPGSNDDSCQGDSGGPIVLMCNGTLLQIAIVSYGDQFCPNNKPGVYTRISAFTSWIESVTKIPFEMLP